MCVDGRHPFGHVLVGLSNQEPRRLRDPGSSFRSITIAEKTRNEAKHNNTTRSGSGTGVDKRGRER